MARRSDHTREELRDLILNAASDLVGERRAEGVTARLIAERIGYTAGTLYTLFDNLTDIFLHVNGMSVERLRGECEKAIAGVADSREALVAMGHAYLDFSRRQPNHFALMFTQQLPHGDAVPAWLSERIDALFALVEELLSSIAPQAAPEAIALGSRVLWSGVHGTSALSVSDQLFTKRWQVDRQMIRSLVENYLDGWMARYC